MDLLNPKPKMAALPGQPIPESLGPVKKSATGGALETVVASPRKFRPYGQSGVEFSDLLPHTGQLAHELCVVRSLHCEQANHDPAHRLLGNVRAGQRKLEHAGLHCVDVELRQVNRRGQRVVAQRIHAVALPRRDVS